MKAGLIVLAAGSLVGSVAADSYYDPPVSSSSIKTTSSAYYYDDPSYSSSSTKASSSLGYNYDDSYSTVSSYKSSSTPAYPIHTKKTSKSYSGSYSKHASHTKYASSGVIVAPIKPVSTCQATTTTVTVYASAYDTPVNAVVPSSSYATVIPITAAPTPIVTVYSTPGAYALPTVTVHLNNTITIIAKKTTTLTSGTNYFGGYTTTVNATSTITVPYVATETNGAKVTEVVSYSTTVCPSAGVYTPVAPTVTVVSTQTVIVYAVPTSYGPGDYTVPAATYTATAYNEVYVCEYESVTAVNVATVTAKYTTSAIASVYYTSSSTPAAPVVPSVYSSAYGYASSSVAAPPSSWSSAAASPSAAPVKVNGKKWAMTYTPYNDAGQCKTAAEVDADIAIIAGKGFTTVRLYATDCSGLINIGASAKTHGLKIIVGVFIEASGIDAARPQLTDIVTWGSAGNWDLVTFIVIGNEAIFNNYCTASALASFITEAKSTFAAAGYYGSITTTEPLGSLQASAGALCGVIDIVAANIQPYFNSGVQSSQAGTFVSSQLALVAAACPGKTAYNLESGWPSSGSPNGAAYATPADQSAAIADIVDKAGDNSVIFSYGNDPWKADGTFGVEKYFGCSQLF